MSSDNFVHPEKPPIEKRDRWGLESKDTPWENDRREYKSYLDAQKIYPPRFLQQSMFWTPAVLIALVIFICGTLFGVVLTTFAPSFRAFSLPQIGSQASANAGTSGVPLLSLPVTSNIVSLSIHDLAAGTLRVQTSDTDHVTVNETTSTGSDTPSVQSSQQGGILTLTISNQTSSIFDVSIPRQVSLDLQAASASLLFAGSLVPQNTYQFSSETGSIDLSISAGSAFRLDEIIDAGDFTNAFGTDGVGSDPRAILNILAYNGSVDIQKN